MKFQNFKFGIVCGIGALFSKAAMADFNSLQNSLQFQISPITLTEDITFNQNLSYGITYDAILEGNYFSLKGDNLYKGFNVSAGVDLTITQTIFENFAATLSTDLGSVLNLGELSNNNLSSVTFTNTQTVNGGAVIYNKNAVLNLSMANFNRDSDVNTGIITYGAGGRGIMNTGGATLTVADSNFYYSTASDNMGGGAIYNDQNSEITVSGTNFEKNQSSAGGAIYTSGKTTLSEVSFKDNTSTNDGGAIYASIQNLTDEIDIFESIFTGNTANNNGGAIYSSQPENYSGRGLSFYNVEFSNNTATNGLGGAIYNAENSHIRLVGDNGIVTFSGNTANGVSNAIHNEGIIYLNAGGNGIRLTTNSSGTIIINDAITGINGNLFINDSVQLPTNGVVYVNNTISGNNLTLEDGTLSFSDNTIREHFSSGDFTSNGGTLWLDVDLNANQIDTISATNVYGNIVIDSLRIMSDSDTAKQLDVFKTSSTGFTVNAFDAYTNTKKYTITEQTGGELLFTPSSGNIDGFKTAAQATGTRSFTFLADYKAPSTTNVAAGEFTIFGNLSNALNYTLNASGELDLTSIPGIGGNTYIFDGQNSYSFAQLEQNAILNVVDSVIANGRSQFGGSIYNDKSGSQLFVYNSIFYNNYATSNGGAVSSGKIVNIFDSAFINNHATANGGGFSTGQELSSIYNSIFDGNTAGGLGGAFSGRGVLNAADLTVINNSATHGGGLYTYIGSGSISGKSNTTVANSIFNDNDASVNGGAVYAGGDYTNITQTSFTNNSAANGGAIYNSKMTSGFTSLGNLNISEDAVFSNNSATVYGGAIYNNSTAVIDETNFINNSSNKFGGAIYNSGIGTASISNGVFMNNSSITDSGGAIYNLGTLNMTSLQFASNTSALSGGAIYNAGDASIRTAQFISNTSNQNGGAIYNNTGSSINIIDTYFGDTDITKNNAGNIASGLGGAIYNNAGTVNIASNTIDILFNGNMDSTGSNAIHNDSGTINLNAGNSYIRFLDKISGAGKDSSIINLNKSDIEIGKDSSDNSVYASDSGLIQMDGTISDNTINLYGGTFLLGADAEFINVDFNAYDNDPTDTSTPLFSLMNGETQIINLGNMSLNNDMNLALDMDLAGGLADQLSATGFTNSSPASTIYISALTMTSQKAEVLGTSTDYIIADATLKNNIELTLDDEIKITDPYSHDLGHLLYYDDTKGAITLSFTNLKDATNVNITRKAYSIGSNEEITDIIGTMGGELLSVSGNGYDVNGNNFGGTSMTTGQVLTIHEVDNYNGFNTTGNGGAIANNGGTLNINNSNFTNNTSSGEGGAIYNSGIFNLTASDDNDSTTNDTITFSGNTANGTDNAIYNSGTINMNTSESSITFEDGISGSGGTININNFETSTEKLRAGLVYFSEEISNNTINMYSGTLGFGAGLSDTSDLNFYGGNVVLRNNNAENVNFGNLTLYTDLNLELEIDLANKTADKISATSYTSNGNDININRLVLLSDPTETPISLQIIDSSLVSDVDLTIDPNLTIFEKNGAIEEYNNYFVGYDDTTGFLSFAYNNLPYAITSSVSQKIYNMAVGNPESIDSDLTLNGTSLHVNANNNNINGNGTITLGNGQTFTMASVATLNANVTNNGTGTLNIYATNTNTTTNGSIVNNGQLNLVTNAHSTLTVNNLSGSGNTQISGSGLTEFTGVISSNDITNDGSGLLFSNNVDIDNFVAKGGNTTFNNATDINDFEATNSAIVNINNSFNSNNMTLNNTTVNIGTNASFGNTTNITTETNDATLNANNSSIKTQNINSLVLNSDLNYSFDVSLENTPSADVLNAVSVTGTGEVILGQINILTNADSMPVTNLNIASASFGNKIDISSATLVNSTGTSENYTGYFIGYDNAGNISFNYAGFENAITSLVAQKAYTFGTLDENNTSDLVMMGDELTLNGNNQSITGSGSITVANSSQELTIKNIASNSNDIINNGILEFVSNTTDTDITGNVTNNNELNITTDADNTITFDGTYSDSGETNIDGNAIFNGATSANLNINSGATTLNNSFNGNIILGGATLNFGSSFNPGSNTNLETTGGGNIDLIDDNFETYNINNLKLSGNTNLGLDIGLDTDSADILNATSVDGTGKIIINELNIMSDASVMPDSGRDVTVATGALLNDDYIDLASGINLSITNSGTATENYIDGYLISYDDVTGKLNFKYSDLEYAITSTVPDKAFAMTGSDTIDTALVLNGNSLTLDGNGANISGNGSIDLNGNELALRETTITDVSIDVNNGELNLYDDTTLNTTITGTGTTNINGNVFVNSDMSGFSGVTNLNSGTLSFNANPVEFFGDFNVLGASTLDIANNDAQIFDTASWNLGATLNTIIDVDLVAKSADSFLNTSLLSDFINITGFNILTDRTDSTTISVSDDTGGGKFSIDSLLTIANGPIYQYTVDSSKLLSDGEITFNGPSGYNPTILMGSVMSQVNTISQMHIMEQSLTNFMNNGKDGVWGNAFYNSVYEKTSPAFWTKAYGFTETADLGYNIETDGQYYGALFGVDTPSMCSGDCLDTLFTAYAGYYGSNQSYDGGDLKEDGFVAGIRAALLKTRTYSVFSAHYATGEFNATTPFGTEDAQTKTFGLSNKTGYNMWIKYKKTSLQPILNISYLQTTRSDYVTAAGINITEEKLNTLQLGTELRLTHYFENDWHGYTSVGYNWNNKDGNDVYANNALLSDLEIGSYMTYKLGGQKNFNNRAKGYIELEGLTGDRLGVGGKVGFEIKF